MEAKLPPARVLHVINHSAKAEGKAIARDLITAREFSCPDFETTQSKKPRTVWPMDEFFVVPEWEKCVSFCKNSATNLYTQQNLGYKVSRLCTKAIFVPVIPTGVMEMGGVLWALLSAQASSRE